MVFDLRQIFESIDSLKEIDVLLDVSSYEMNNIFPFVNPIRVKGLIENKAGIVSFCYKISSVLSLQCDRCNGIYSYSLDLTMNQTLVRREEKGDYIFCEDNKLDLQELIIADILLSLPTKSLCNDDCKGICSMCGINLNESNCECKKTTCDPRLEILSQLLK